MYSPFFRSSRRSGRRFRVRQRQRRRSRHHHLRRSWRRERLWPARQRPPPALHRLRPHRRPRPCFGFAFPASGAAWARLAITSRRSFSRRLASRHSRSPVSVRSVLSCTIAMMAAIIRPKENCVDRITDSDDQRDDDDQRAGAIEVVGEFVREEFADVAAGAERLAGHFQRAEDEAQKRAEAREEHRRARRFGGGRVDFAAPEVVPADDHHHDGDEVRRVAEQLKRQLGEKRADATGEVDRHRVRARAEEPHRIRRLVAGERHDPDQRRGEQRDADEFAHAP